MVALAGGLFFLYNLPEAAEQPNTKTSSPLMIMANNNKKVVYNLPDQTYDILLIGFDVKIRSKNLIGEYGGPTGNLITTRSLDL
jgi:hypothetical protein